MSTLTYNKQDLIEAIRLRREQAIKDFDRGLAEEKVRAIERLQDLIEEAKRGLTDVRAGRKVHIWQPSISFDPDRQATTYKHNKAIRRLELAQGDSIKLTDKEADGFVDLL